MHYYSFNISVWALHTSHLTVEEEGVFRRLLDHYYDTELPIPKITQPVIRRLRLGSYESTVKSILSEFFILSSDGWHNLRADMEIKDYHVKADAARANGKKGGRPKKNKGLETQPVNSANPDLTQPKANYELGTTNYKLQTSNYLKPTAPSAPGWVDQYIDLFWSEYPKKVDKKKTYERLTKMIKQKPDQQHFAMILEKVRAKALVDDKQFWPSPDRYLREEKWEDEIINQGVNHGQHQQATKPKLSALDRVKANAAERERKRNSAQGGEFDGQGMGETLSDVRPQIHESIRRDTGRHMGNLLEGDFSQTDS
jgi:uncharacterized protein YdaU (DUF1376 family)